MWHDASIFRICVGSLPIASSHLDVYPLCLLVTPRYKSICHTLRLNPSKLAPWKFPASTLSSRPSNFFLWKGDSTRWFFFLFKVTKSRVTRTEILVCCSQVHAACVRADISGPTVVFVHGLCIDDMWSIHALTLQDRWTGRRCWCRRSYLLQPTKVQGLGYLRVFEIRKKKLNAST